MFFTSSTSSSSKDSGMFFAIRSMFASSSLFKKLMSNHLAISGFAKTAFENLPVCGKIS